MLVFRRAPPTPPRPQLNRQNVDIKLLLVVCNDCSTHGSGGATHSLVDKQFIGCSNVHLYLLWVVINPPDQVRI